MRTYKRLCRMNSVSVVAAFLLFLLVAAFSWPDKDPVKIGFVAGLTGRHYNLGISGRHGAMLALEEANEKGGVNGRKIELIVRDDKQDKAEAENVVKELIRQKVSAIIGPVTSAMAEVTLPIVNEHKMLMVSPTVSSSYFAGRDDQFIMLHPSTAIAARHMSAYIRKSLKINTVAVIYDLSNKNFTESWLQNFKKEFDAGKGSVTAAVTFTSGSKDSFLDLAAEALKSRPQAVLIIANALDTAMLCQQIRKTNTKVQLLGSEWAFTGDILKHGGSAIEGMIYIEKVNIRSEEPGYKSFRDKYAGRFGQEPDFAAILSYDAFNVVYEALKKDPATKDLRRALLSIRFFPGVQGSFEIDRNGDAVRRHFIMTIKKNDFVLLEER